MILLLSSLLHAKTHTIASVTASSSFSDEHGSYVAKQLTDNYASKAWVEDEKAAGLGAWIEVKLDASQDINEIELWNGNWYSYNEWDYYNRIKDLEVKFADGSSETFTLKDEKKTESLKLKKPVKSDSVKLIIRSVYKGSAYTDRTAISEVRVKGSGAESYPVAKVSATSELPEDNDGSYYGSNLQDRLIDTAWCSKGAADGASINYDFPASTKVSKIQVVNGNAADFKIFMAYAKPKVFELSFSDGSSEKVMVKPSPKAQTITLSKPRTVKSVKVTPADIYAGKSQPNTCISELRFE